MQRLEAKATTTPTTDLGEFEALVSTWDVDRQGDRIVPGAFSKTIAEWQTVGRVVPLHLEHRPDEIVGQVDPASMRETAQGLEVAGRVDLDSSEGKRIWTQLKRNRLGFSFGYMALADRKRGDGVREILALDVFEVSVTASPANNRTRVLATKALDVREEARAAMLRLSEAAETKHAGSEIKIASFDA